MSGKNSACVFCSLRRLLFRQVNNLYAQTRMTVHLYTDYKNSCRYIIRCRKLLLLPFVDSSNNNKMPLTSRTDDFVLLMHRLHLDSIFEMMKKNNNERSIFHCSSSFSSFQWHATWKFQKKNDVVAAANAQSQKPKVTHRMKKKKKTLE